MSYIDGLILRFELRKLVKRLTFLFALSTSVSSSPGPFTGTPEDDAFLFIALPNTSSLILSFSLAFPLAFPGSEGTLKTSSPISFVFGGSFVSPFVSFCFLVVTPPSPGSDESAKLLLLELAFRLRPLAKLPAPMLLVRLIKGGRRGIGSSGLGTRLGAGFGGGCGVIRATRNLIRRVLDVVTWPKTTMWVVSGPSKLVVNG